MILQRCAKAEREVVWRNLRDKIGTVVIGTVQRVEPRVVQVSLARLSELCLRVRNLANIMVLLRSKVYSGIEAWSAALSCYPVRGNEEFGDSCSAEVPEMETGAVELRQSLARSWSPTKLAVSSALPGVDPVGTLLVVMAARVQAVMNEIGEQEKIDVFHTRKMPAGFIANAMSPAEVLKCDCQ